MSAEGRWVGVADGDGDGAGESGADLVVPGAGALAGLAVLAVPSLFAGAAVPVAGAWDVVPAPGAVEVGVAVDLTGARVVPDAVGMADTVGVAAPVGAAAGLVAVGLDGVAVTVGDVWPSWLGELSRLGELALAVGVA
jgi:hypothetical protein